ncbi:hypothetical protein P152DRAFT_444369 [Eremomyces bilateralis CBS 781.70]|uniref:Uncharacterized protein n=1 Tax=Eremomyces bilateralis CBS 781.70 TaxID=1392243 RepID=A0A6G1FR11_9PEZI|nr:uncharacterized protein P152DRAFT_444369 [Eremomyces bilateralis CBS 781.70]KAF1808168.1 hypothetical protein P152DRAFT_444369 [Eremomyces bilateralis CBS 781.70]
MENDPPYPVYGTTYTAFRVSPLYHRPSNPSSDLSLSQHARRLRDVLRGDSVRGVQLSTGDSMVAPVTGTLQRCTWERFGDEPTWHRAHAFTVGEHEDDLSQSTEQPTLAEAVGIRIELQYDRAVHSALLLKDPEPSSPTPGFSSFPLLLLRMPTHLRDTVIEYLQRAFDAHIAPLRLRSAFLTASLERSFASSPNDDLATTDPPISGPFTAALDRYISEHLAFSLRHPAVSVIKVACAQFAFTAEGKVKITPPMDSDQLDHSGVDLDATERMPEWLYKVLIKEARTSQSAVAMEDVATKVAG